MQDTTAANQTAELRSKTLVMLVGPTASGKSTVIQAACQLDKSFSYVQSFTSRAQRDVYDNSYMFLPLKQVHYLHDTGQTVTYVEHPTTGDIYGTTLSSYRTEFCVLDTLFNTVDTYQNLPFARTIMVSLTTPAQKWLEHFHARFDRETPEADKRRAEAALSINWSLEQSTNHFWLVNDSTPEAAATKLIAIAKGQSTGDDGAPIARTILELLAGGG